MGFINPTPPPFDVQEWKKKPHLERVKPLAQDWAVNGFGTPYAIYLLYILKLVGFTAGAFAIIGSSTPGLGGLGDLGDWWTQPIVWQKFVVWMILWEIIGLGSSSMPLSFRFLPPIGNSLAWLRPGTIRLPPWPDKVPGTKGSTRTIFDVALYAGVLVTGFYLLFSDGTDVAQVGGAGRLNTTGIVVMLALLIALGLRDKVSYLSSRPELYGLLLVVFLFPIDQMIVASQFVLFFIWMGAASSKLNHHFPNVVAVMVSNTPWNRSKTIKKRLYKNHPEDLRPSREAVMFAHLGTVIEYALPLVLIASSGGTIGKIAVIGMIIFHVHITSTFPLAVPLEWNLFMIFGTVLLFGHYGEVPLSTLDNPLLILILLVSLVAIPVLGNLRPDKISFLPSMRYYAGNWATSQWLFRNDVGAEETFDKGIVKSSPVVKKQLTTLYDEDMAEIFMTKALAFRALHNQGRALNGLLFRAVDELEDYTVREGEFLAGAAIGWNFGDGHFHGKQLLDAVQERLHYKPGELRIVTMESQPAHVQTQQYQIWDAATGLIEEGYVNVRDMMDRQPWLDPTGAFPVHVTGPGAPRDGTTAPPRAGVPA
ncbi:MAG: hypothetical protein JWO02_2113 [Solirubrobacterales bacterium]|nr:hypothetical protein [Solirubrobacterales bacterium]